jgi:hypothetical protein
LALREQLQHRQSGLHVVVPSCIHDHDASPAVLGDQDGLPASDGLFDHVFRVSLQVRDGSRTGRSHRPEYSTKFGALLSRGSRQQRLLGRMLVYSIYPLYLLAVAKILGVIFGSSAGRISFLIGSIACSQPFGLC